MFSTMKLKVAFCNLTHHISPASASILIPVWLTRRKRPKRTIKSPQWHVCPSPPSRFATMTFQTATSHSISVDVIVCCRPPIDVRDKPRCVSHPLWCVRFRLVHQKQEFDAFTRLSLTCTSERSLWKLNVFQSRSAKVQFNYVYLFFVICH